MTDTCAYIHIHVDVCTTYTVHVCTSDADVRTHTRTRTSPTNTEQIAADIAELTELKRTQKRAPYAGRVRAPVASRGRLGRREKDPRGEKGRGDGRGGDRDMENPHHVKVHCGIAKYDFL